MRLAQDTDLLMHEAIDFDWVERAYAHEEPEIAQASVDHHHKSHTSPQQAGSIAARAGARALALHHLVPGTADPGVWRRAKETFDGPLCVPDDLEVISFARQENASPTKTEQV